MLISLANSVVSDQLSMYTSASLLHGSVLWSLDSRLDSGVAAARPPQAARGG